MNWSQRKRSKAAEAAASAAAAAASKPASQQTDEHEDPEDPELREPQDPNAVGSGDDTIMMTMMDSMGPIVEEEIGEPANDEASNDEASNAGLASERDMDRPISSPGFVFHIGDEDAVATSEDEFRTACESTTGQHEFDEHEELEEREVPETPLRLLQQTQPPPPAHHSHPNSLFGVPRQLANRVHNADADADAGASIVTVTAAAAAAIADTRRPQFVDGAAEMDDMRDTRDTSTLGLGPAPALLHPEKNVDHANNPDDGDESSQSRAAWWRRLEPHRLSRAREACLPAQWLNDNVVSMALELLTATDPNLRTLSSFYLDSNARLASALSSDGFQAHVATVLAQPHEQLADIVGHTRNMQLVLVFHVSGNHWVCTWVDVQARTCRYTDSLPSQTTHSKTEAIAKALVAKLPAPFNSDWASGWTIEAVPCSRQNNLHDCGVYALAAAFHLAAGLPVLSLDQATFDPVLWRLFLGSLLDANTHDNDDDDYTKNGPRSQSIGSGSAAAAPIMTTTASSAQRACAPPPTHTSLSFGSYVPNVDDDIPYLEPPKEITQHGWASLGAVDAAREYASSLKRHTVHILSDRAKHVAQQVRAPIASLHDLIERIATGHESRARLETLETGLREYHKGLTHDVAAICNAVRSMQSLHYPSHDALAMLESQGAAARRRMRFVQCRLAALRDARETLGVVAGGLSAALAKADNVEAQYKQLIEGMASSEVK